MEGLSIYWFWPHLWFMNCVYILILTHWGRVTHICISNLDHHCFRQWLVAWPAPSHYLNQCWNTVNWTPRNKLQWNIHLDSYIFIQENLFENIICEKASFCLSINVLVHNNSTYSSLISVHTCKNAEFIKFSPGSTETRSMTGHIKCGNNIHYAHKICTNLFVVICLVMML